MLFGAVVSLKRSTTLPADSDNCPLGWKYIYIFFLQISHTALPLFISPPQHCFPSHPSPQHCSPLQPSMALPPYISPPTALAPPYITPQHCPVSYLPSPPALDPLHITLLLKHCSTFTPPPPKMCFCALSAHIHSTNPFMSAPCVKLCSSRPPFSAAVPPALQSA